MGTNRKPYLESLMKKEGLNREALLIAIYFVTHHVDAEKSVAVPSKTLSNVLRLRQPNVTRGIQQLKAAKFLRVITSKTDRRAKKYRLASL